MANFTDLQRDSGDLGELVNENKLVTTRYGGNKKSWQYLVDQFETEFAEQLLEINKSRGYRVVGAFAAGFDYELFNDVGIDASGNSWIYVGTGAPVKTVTAGTVPSAPDYQQVTYNSIDAVSGLRSALNGFATVAAMRAGVSISDDGNRVEWRGYYSESDGGSNWGIVKTGDSTSLVDDGGSIFIIVNDAVNGVWVEANLKGKKVNVKKFGARVNQDSTAAFLGAVAAAKSVGSLVYVPAAMTIGDFYIVNAQLDLTACGMVGDGRDASRILMNTGADDSILHRGDGALTLYTVLKGIYIRNNGSTGNAVSWDLAPRHNYMSDVKIYGWRDGAAVVIRDSTWITDMDDVFLDNCKWGLKFERTQTIGNVGGSHTFRGGAIEGCERAVEGSVKNLAFYGTAIEGNQGIPETFANNDRVGGVCKLGIGEGPIAFHDCWFEGNGLPAIITGVGATSEATATTQVTVNGGRHEAEKLIWIMGVTSQISLRDLNFDRTAVARNAIIWVQNISSQSTSVLIENCRYRQDYQRIYDPYTYNYLPKTYMIHNGGRVLFPSNANGDVFAAAQTQLKYERLDNVSLSLVLDNWVQGNGNQRTVY